MVSNKVCTRKKRLIELCSILVLVLGAWSVPENYYYMKDKNITIYMPIGADNCFSLTEAGQPINISNNTIYGYYDQDTRVYFPVYNQCYYTRANYGTVYISFDPETFESNLNFVSSKAKRIDPVDIVVSMVAVIMFLQLVSYNAFRVRKARERSI